MKTQIEREDFETNEPGRRPWSAERPNGKIVRHTGGECWLIVLLDETDDRGNKLYARASLLDGTVVGRYTADELMALVNGDSHSLIWPMRVEAGVYVTANKVFGGR